MAVETITILQLCSDCKSEVGSFEVKKENMMLRTKDLVWCFKCNANKPEVRDIAGRSHSIQEERETYPVSGPSSGAVSKTNIP